MRVLMSAYACEPNRGSEPGVGWNWALQAARFHEVWVLTRANNRAAIDAELQRRPVPNLHLVYHDLPRWARFWKRGGRGVHLYYLLWQFTAPRAARAAHRRRRFDLIHHVTFNAVDSPGWLWRLGLPFVWGPVGGGQEPPPALKGYFGRAWGRERRRIARKRLTRFNPVVRAAVRSAACILVANTDTQRLLSRLKPAVLIREVETAVKVPDPPVPPVPPRVPNVAGISILWAGLLIPRKAPLLAVDVLAELRRREVAARLQFVGDGPLRGQIEAHAHALGIADAIDLRGRVPYEAMSRCYASADVFLFTSLQDTSGNVLLEAMAHGLPVVTLDHQGAAEIVAADCGIKIPIGEPPRVIAGFGDALERLAARPELRHTLGEAGRRRVAERYRWDRKGDLLRQLYARAVGVTS
ncbi:MAG: glycosyltransferase family 4 protein [Thermomicrobiales bacterium]